MIFPSDEQVYFRLIKLFYEIFKYILAYFISGINIRYSCYYIGHNILLRRDIWGLLCSHKELLLNYLVLLRLRSFLHAKPSFSMQKMLLTDLNNLCEDILLPFTKNPSAVYPSEHLPEQKGDASEKISILKTVVLIFLGTDGKLFIYQKKFDFKPFPRCIRSSKSLSFMNNTSFLAYSNLLRCTGIHSAPGSHNYWSDQSCKFTNFTMIFVFKNLCQSN